MSLSDIRSNNTVANIRNWFARISERPSVQDRNVQLGVHFEEISEMLIELKGVDHEVQLKLNDAYGAMHQLATFFKENSKECLVTVPNRIAFLDACCDQIVTAIGAGQRFEMNIVGATNEVDESNWSKFDENGKPYRNEQGKVIKGPNYREPDLSSFV